MRQCRRTGTTGSRRTGGCWRSSQRRRSDGLEARRSARGDEAHAGPIVGRDDPADRSARPVHLRVGILRPAHRDAHPRAFGAGRAIDDMDEARLARCAFARDGAPSDRPQADAGRMAEQRKLLVGRAEASGRRSAAASPPPHIAASRPAFHRARCSCQTPRPIITATAPATTIVGIERQLAGQARSVLRGRDGHIPARSAHALADPEAAERQTRPTGIQTRCTHQGGDDDRSTSDRGDGQRPRRRSGSGTPRVRRRR